MINKMIMCLLAFMPLTATLQAQYDSSTGQGWGRPYQKLPPPRVKVLIEHDQDSVVLDVNGRYKIRDPYQGFLTSNRYTGKVKFIQAVPEGLKWGEEFPGVHQLEIIPTSFATTISVNGKQYKGTIIVYDIGGTVSVVNDVEIEDYISGIANNKYPATLPEETLAALAIAERTNAYFFSQNPKSNFWALDGNLAGYKGIVAYDPASPVQKAVLSTRHMVLTPAGSYPEEINAFPLSWDPPVSKFMNVNPKPVSAVISIAEAQELAKKGDHAAIILDKAFPRTTLRFLRLPN
jgi:stage II sporulation protein D